MLTKVSYNAYSLSANGVQKQNQAKNVNFGGLSREAKATLTQLLLEFHTMRWTTEPTTALSSRDAITTLTEKLAIQAPDATLKDIIESAREITGN